MEFLSDTVVLSRLQFALTSMFHMLWPVLTIGMANYLIIVEALWLKTRNPDYYYQARFWSKLYLLNFGIGVATGVPMEFQFGTNWGPFSTAVGDFFGSVLGFEATMAFMLEAGFLGIMLFGWNRVPPVMHFIATIFVAIGASLSAFWIVSANSWMQTPAGGEMIDGKFVVRDFFQAIFNPSMLDSVFHMYFATVETALFVIGGISAWYLLGGKHRPFFARSLKIVIATALIVAPLQILIGHLSTEQVYHNQPSKFAAMEAQWETVPAGESAPWALVALPNKEAQANDFALEIPNGLGYLLALKKELQEPVLGLKAWKAEDRPGQLSLVFYSFRVMVAAGMFFMGLMGWSVVEWLRGKLTLQNISQQRWLMRAWVLAAPLGYIAVEAGWIVREVGRQPWVLYGEIRISDAATNLPASNVLTSLIAFSAVYSILFVSALYFGRRILLEGPNLELQIPGTVKEETINVSPGEHQPDRRPAEVQQ
ncbi:MAG: cytochrome ubiquinol oxidase subunit I [Hormoscilla sp.]